MNTPGEGAMVLLSAIQHYLYCPRQAYLISKVGLFTHDERTSAGAAAHDYTDGKRTKRVDDGWRITGTPVWSDIHGFYGIPDAIEVDSLEDPTRISVIENKIGGIGGASRVQVTGAAIALREMYPQASVRAFLFSYASRRRESVDIDGLSPTFLEALDAVRGLTLATANRRESRKRCGGCSMRFDCLPAVLEEGM